MKTGGMRTVKRIEWRGVCFIGLLEKVCIFGGKIDIGIQNNISDRLMTQSLLNVCNVSKSIFQEQYQDCTSTLCYIVYINNFSGPLIKHRAKKLS